MDVVILFPCEGVNLFGNIIANGDKAQVEVSPVQCYKTDGPKSLWVDTTKEEVQTALKDMITMRRMEIAADLMYKSQVIKGFCHLYDGQEAVCIGMEMGCTKKDHIVTSYRDHCFQYSRGDTVQRVLTELTGRFGGTFVVAMSCFASCLFTLRERHCYALMRPVVFSRTAQALPKARADPCTCTIPNPTSGEETALWARRLLFSPSLTSSPLRHTGTILPHEHQREKYSASTF